jgi:hypothetical protein
MNKIFTKEALAGWIKGLKQAAKEDEQFSVSWFIPTKESPLSIVGGWENGFSPREADLFCQSKSEPTFAMCIKIVVNEGPYAYCDFETLNMPVDDREEVEDTCIALEWKDDPAKVAEFYMMEWERLMDLYGKGDY